jgi:hypothetical protein
MFFGAMPPANPSREIFWRDATAAFHSPAHRAQDILALHH